MTTSDRITLSILMPCLNEARTLGICIQKAQSYLSKQDFIGEIIVADNGSTDGSVGIAESLGARVVHVAQRGYGNALQAGIEAALGEFVIMGDADDSYDFERLDVFVEALRAGNDLVLGNRFKGGIESGAMPALHRYFGNPLLTAIGKLLFKSPVNDFYCGLRGFRRAAISQLALSSPGMEFALEMVVKATIHGLAITEVPTTLRPDGRGRPPHLRSWRDGWRSLRFYLLLSPDGLFLYPGLTLFAVSGIITLVLFLTDIRIGSVVFAQHTLIVTCALTVVGIQAVFFWAFAKDVAIQKGLLFPDATYSFIKRSFNLEKFLSIGGALVLVGVALACYALIYWYHLSFGPVEGNRLIKLVCAASLLISVGFHFIFASFFMLLLEQRPKDIQTRTIIETVEVGV